MARPRKDSGIVPARERIADAFWSMLEEMPYREISLQALCLRAGVNHNSFYYYFPNIEAMSQELVHENLIPELPASIMEMFAGDRLSAQQVLADPLVQKRFSRFLLLAGPHGAPHLMVLLKRYVQDVWFAALGIEEDQLDLASRARFAFILGGMLELLGMYAEYGTEAVVSAVVESGLSESILASLNDMAHSKGEA